MIGTMSLVEAPIKADSLKPDVARRRSPLNRLWVMFLTASVILVWSISVQARPAPDSFADLAEKLLPAVVNISTTQVVEGDDMGPEQFQFPPGSPFEEFFKEFQKKQQQPDNRPRKGMSLGSGFIISPEGYIVTNNHVIAEAEEINVILQDDTQLKAEIVGRDAKTDLALLKVASDKPLPHVTLGDSSVARVGDWVMAIGNPFGLGGSVTAGIISARARDINSGPYDDYIQTDASINRGNSGGPLFNLKGEVIGINTAIYSPSGGSVGIGFSIPADLAQPVLKQLREFGKTRRGWLGVRIQAVNEEIAESLGLKEPRGALIAKVNEDEPAARAGLKAGDIILEFDGKKVPNVRKLQRIVADTPINKDVPIVVWRDEKMVKLNVSIGELEAYEEIAKVENGNGGSEKPSGKKTIIESVGLTLSPITPSLRERFELNEEVKGVLIVGVDDEGVAAEKGLRPSDIIVEVGQEEVSTPEAVEEKITAAVNSDRKSVLMLVQRNGDLRFVPLRVVKSDG